MTMQQTEYQNKQLLASYAQFSDDALQQSATQPTRGVDVAEVLQVQRLRNTTAQPHALDVLKAHAWWVGSYEDKSPHSPLNNEEGASNKPHLWGTYAQVLAAKKRYSWAYIGVCCAHDAETSLVFFDMDHCIDDAGNVARWARDIVDNLDSYTEISPSGDGLHVIVKASIESDAHATKRRDDLPELYQNSNRWLTVTGNQLAGTRDTIEERQAETAHIHERTTKLLQAPHETAAQPQRKPQQSDIESALDMLALLAPYRADGYYTWLRVGFALSEFGEAGLAAWIEWSKRSTKYEDGDCKKRWGKAGFGTRLDARALWGMAKDDAPTAYRAYWEAQRRPTEEAEATEETESTEKKERGRPKKLGLLAADLTTLYSGWGYDFALNTLDDSIENHLDRFSDIDSDILMAKVQDHCTLYGFRDAIQLARWSISKAANYKQYHPVKQYLEALKWDGADHISTLTAHFRDKDDVFPRWFELWVIGAVAKAYTGYQNPALALLGAQGSGRSYFTHWLCAIPKLYYAGPVIPRSRDCKLRLTNTWIWEIEELDATTRKADVADLKAFLTLERVRLRKAYGRNDIDKPALSSFIGTSNPDVGFLVDKTGNRRFLTCEITAIDWAYARSVDVNQLWAQAYSLYKKDESWKMTTAEREYRDTQNQEHMTPDPLRDWLGAHIEITGNANDKLTFGNVWEFMRATVPESQYKSCSYTLASWMKQQNIPGTRGRTCKEYSGVCCKA